MSFSDTQPILSPLTNEFPLGARFQSLADTCVARGMTMWISYCSRWILECVAKNGSYESRIWSDLCQHHVSPNVRVYDLCEKAYKYKLNLYFLHEPTALLPLPPSSSSSLPCAGDKTQGLSHARQELISELYPDWWCGFIFSWLIFVSYFCHSEYCSKLSVHLFTYFFPNEIARMWYSIYRSLRVFLRVSSGSFKARK